MYKNIAIDCETTMAPNHLPWLDGSALICVSIARDDNTTQTWFFNHPDRERHHEDKTYKDCIEEIQAEINGAERVIAHNLKFDYHWLRAMGFTFDNTKLYCTMVGEYTINAQQRSEGMSLEELSIKYKLPMKKDKVKIYWDAGVDTWEIPVHILAPYSEQDAVNALAIFYKQVPRIAQEKLQTIISLEMEVLRCVADMELNGMIVDKDKLEQYNIVYGKELEELDGKLRSLLHCDNIESPQQLSKALFGLQPDVQGVFDPKKFGISAIAKEGYYSVAVPELLKLKGKTPAQKEIIDGLRHRSRLSQLRSTYFTGLSKHLIGDKIHHTINQCITVTGRTSCSRPNLQNQPRGNTGPVKECFISRFL